MQGGCHQGQRTPPALYFAFAAHSRTIRAAAMRSLRERKACSVLGALVSHVPQDRVWTSTWRSSGAQWSRHSNPKSNRKELCPEHVSVGGERKHVACDGMCGLHLGVQRRGVSQWRQHDAKRGCTGRWVWMRCLQMCSTSTHLASPSCSRNRHQHCGPTHQDSHTSEQHPLPAAGALYSL